MERRCTLYSSVQVILKNLHRGTRIARRTFQVVSLDWMVRSEKVPSGSSLQVGINHCSA